MKRANNEDNYLINDELSLFVVCDGMGGHVGGEFASAIAVNTVEEVLASIEADPDSLPDRDEDMVEHTREKLRYAVRLAGKRIFEKASADPEFKGMGTTVVVLLLDAGNVFIGHVGDSRAYRVRGSQIEQLTEDHSLVNEKIKAGLITKEEAANHRMRNIITRSLGFQEDVEIDTQVHAIQKGDRYLLCSDGLSGLVTGEEIGETVRSENPQDAARALTLLACERGGDDNVTTVVVRIDEA